MRRSYLIPTMRDLKSGTCGGELYGPTNEVLLKFANIDSIVEKIGRIMCNRTLEGGFCTELKCIFK